MKKTLFLLFFVFHGYLSYSQWAYPEFKLQTQAYTSVGDQAPFWFINGNNGQYELQNSNWLSSVALGNQKPHDSLSFSFKYGLELDYALNNQQKHVWLQQGYVKTRVYWLELLAGRYYQYMGNGDSTLSSGYLMYSNNTKPLPKIGLGSYGWIDVPYTEGYLELKGLIQHGWFENNRYVKHAWLHHKNFYVRLGGDLPVNLSGGLDHYAQWAGTSNDPEYGEFPSDFDTFKEVLMAENADSSDTSLPDNERFNRVGNHLGSWNFRLDVETSPMNMALYYQSIFEDKSGYRRKISPDGLWGLSFNFQNWQKLDKVVLEFVKTTFQSGPVHDPEEGKKGNDNYFNNGLYRNGWTVNRFTIGTPFITSPLYFGDDNIRFLNNRVLVYYLGFSGKLGPVSYEARTAYSNNKGTHSKPFDPYRDQFSTIVTARYTLSMNHTFYVKCAYDSGTMYGDNFGIGLSYAYRFSPFH